MMASVEPLLKKLKKSKKIKPRFESLDGSDNENINTESNEEIEPLISANEFSPSTNQNESVESSQVILPNSSPSAPPEEQYKPTGLQNDKIRSKFVQKVYGVLLVQQSIFCALIALFVYIPHLRKIVRKWVFDPLFYYSVIGVPLCVFFGLLIISTSLRKKFAFLTMILITISLSLLVSYAITVKTANAFVYSIGSSDLCCLGVMLGSKKLDFTKWRYISLIPLTMIGSSALAPTILKTSLNNTIWPSILMTSLMTYLGANTRPVIKYNDLEIEPNEYVFAATQLYLNPEQPIKHYLKTWICGRDRRRDTSSYATI